MSTSGRRRSVAEEPVTSVLKGGDIPVNNTGVEWNADEEVLAALGYKPEFKREFTLWTTFSVSFSVLGLLPSFATTLYYGMGYAGTAGRRPDGSMYTSRALTLARHDMGMDRSYGRNPVRRIQHG